jgi:hypothetical protein
LTLSGCSKVTSVSNSPGEYNIITNPVTLSTTPESVEEEGSNLGDYGYGLTTSFRDDTVEFTGEALVYPMNYRNNGEAKLEAGLMLTLDGIIQPFSVVKDGETLAENTTMYNVELAGKESSEFDVVFSPVTGVVGDTLGLYFHSLLAPSFGPTNDQYPHYGVYHKSAIMGPQKVKMSADSANATFNVSKDYNEYSISQELRDSHRGLENSDTYLNDNTVFAIGDNPDYTASGQRFTGNGNVNIYMRGFGGDSVTYRTAAFVNHKQIKINGADYIEYTIEKGEVAEFQFPIELAGDARYSTFYTITTPVGKDYLKPNAYPIKSESMLLVNENVAADPNEKPLAVQPAEPQTETPAISDTIETTLPPQNDIPEVPQTEIPEVPQTEIPANPQTNANISGTTVSLKDDAIGAYYVTNEKVLVKSLSLDSDSSGGFGFGSSESSIIHKLSIVSIADSSVLAQTESIKGYQQLGNQRILSDKIIVPALDLMNGNVDLLVFDHNLHLTKTISLADKMGIQIVDISAVAISADGSKAVATNTVKAVIYDLNSGKTQTVFEAGGSSSVDKTLTGIMAVEFCNNDKDLAIYGGVASTGGDSKVVFGIVSIADKTVTYFADENVDTIIQVTTNAAVWDDKSMDYGVSSSGKLKIVSYSDRKLNSFSLTKMNESQEAYISPDGKKIVTFEENYSTNTAKVRVYDVASGKVTSEFDVAIKSPFGGFSGDSSRFVIIENGNLKEFRI